MNVIDLSWFAQPIEMRIPIWVLLIVLALSLRGIMK